MTCPACNDVGYITVRQTLRTGKGTAEHEKTVKLCPMGCKPPRKPSGRLKGREMTLDQLRAETANEEDNPPIKSKDYSDGSQTFDIHDWYGIPKKT
jgi:hypothetical protein